MIKRICKKSITIVLALILSFSAYASVVSDNDGSAFITKAEFDSLKNNFQQQIDQYNTSIDSKIDTAIAQYLAGISISVRSPKRLLYELDNVGFGNGYRAYNISTLSERVGDLATWLVSSTITVPSAGYWRDINNGLVSGLYETATDGDYYNLAAHSGGTAYTYRVISDQWTSYTGRLGDFQVWTITTLHNGVLKPEVVSSNRPLLFVNDYGMISSFDNSRITIIDARAYRGYNYPTSMGRGIILFGNSYSGKPSFSSFRFNTSYQMSSYGGPIDPSSIYTTYLQPGVGNIKGLVTSATKSYNNNIFCWNLNDTSVVDAFSDGKEGYYVNSKQDMTNWENKSEMSQVTIARGAGLDQTSGGTQFTAKSTFISRPEIHFDQAKFNTTLPESCFSDDGTDYYKKLKAQYLCNADIKTSEGLNAYIYDGLPIYKAEKPGKLEFDIQVDTNYNSAAYYFTDPGTTSSKICLRIKSDYFGWGNDTTNAVKMKVATSVDEVEEALIDRGSKTTIKIDCEEGKTYWLRWYVDGYSYGGEITYIGNGFFTDKND